MANQILSMNKLHLILRFLIAGKSRRFISRTIPVSRKAVDKYAALFEAHPYSLAELYKLPEGELNEVIHPGFKPSSTQLELYEHFGWAVRQLKKVGVTKQHLWENYKAEHARCQGYSQYCDHFSKYLKSQQLSYVFDHKAGDKLMVDYAGKKLKVVDYETGEVASVEFFVGVLACSGYTFAMASKSQQSPDFLGCLGACLDDIGGVPAAIVTNNLKPAVNKASKYDPEINSSMADFAQHYDTVVLPTRAYSPKDKALVEGAVKILYTRVYAKLADKLFYSIQDLNVAIAELVKVHNNMAYQNKIGSRMQQFETLEKEKLKGLPVLAFELSQYQLAKVHPNCHVVLSEDKHHYSVPYQYVGKKVKIKYSNEQVTIYCNYTQIAIHERLRTKYRYTTNTTHLHPKHKYYSNWSSDFFEAEGAKIGDNTQLLMNQILAQSKHPEQGFKLCQGVLQLKKKYGKEDLELACEICIQYDIISYRKLEYILQNALLDLEENKRSRPKIDHRNIRGVSYYQ
jgi:transposase